jgi:hypothetical protein
MKKFKVYIQAHQTWTYVYEVTAENVDEAERLGLLDHESGAEASNNWVDSEEYEAFQTIQDIPK